MAFVVGAASAQPAEPQRDTEGHLAASPPRTMVTDAIVRWAPLEFDLQIPFEVQNPFDPDEVSVQLRIQCPSGRVVALLGFYCQDYARKLVEVEGKHYEHLDPDGDGAWRARYTPTEVGVHQYFVRARCGEQTQQSPVQQFDVAAGDERGLVRADAGKRYLRFDNGEPFFAIGHNLCWSGNRGTFDYDDWLAKMQQSGENCTRLWLGPFNLFAIEHAARWDGDPLHIGDYDLEAAWKLDQVLATAHEHGIQAILVLLSFNDLSAKHLWGQWDKSVFNAANGGACAKPEHFFTSEGAQRAFRNRVRYIAARYSHWPNVLAWELWNEIDLVDGYASDQARRWHQDTARYLRDIDPYDHIVTTSFSRARGDRAVDGIPELDLVQTHLYGAKDMPAGVARWSRQKQSSFGRPHLVGEFSGDPMGKRQDADTRGVQIHNGIWASLACGDAGVAMTWWWDTYVEKYDLYPVFAPLAEFVRDVPWCAETFEPIAEADIEIEPAGANSGPPDVMGLRSPNRLLLWARNPAHTWWTVVSGNRIQPTDEATLTVSGLEAGRYEVTLFDTWTGGAVQTLQADAPQGRLRLPIPALETDLAVKAVRAP